MEVERLSKEDAQQDAHVLLFSHMLKKTNRLPARQKFDNPNLFRSSLFTAKFSKNNMEVNRFGFVVRKALDKRAVARNRIKRLIRSCIEEMIDEIQSGWDMLFVLEKGIIGKERKEIFLEVKRFLIERKLLK